MKKRYYIVPLLYIFISLLLLSNYIISSRKATIYWGDVAVSITASDQKSQNSLKKNGLTTTPVSISKITISFPYAKFSLNSHINITPESNQTSTYLSTISALTTGDGFILSFDDRVFASFQTKEINPEEIAVIVQSNIDENIQIPMITNWGMKSNFVANSLHLKSLNNQGVIRPSHQAEISKFKNHWLLSTKNQYAVFYFSDGIQTQSNMISSVPVLSPTTTGEASQVIDQYIDAAYKGLMFDRFDNTTGTWQQPEGFYSFSENALIVVYSEAILRQELLQHKIHLDRTAVLNEHGLSWRSATFYKNGPTLFESFENYVLFSQHFVLEEIKKDNKDFILYTDFWSSMPFWKNSTTRKTFFDFVLSKNPINESPEASTMYLYQSSFSLQKEFASIIEDRKETFEQNILNNIVIANDGYMLLDSNGNINTFFSIVAGKYLSQHASKKNIRLLGDRILITALSLADENGILPRTYLIKDTGLISLGFIVPEEVYFIINNNKDFSKIVYKDKEGIYEFSLSTNTYIQNETDAVISLQTPITDITQFVYLWPIYRPQSILGFDAFWVGSSYPSNFTQGIEYKEGEKLLIIKTLNRNNPENIRLFF